MAPKAATAATKAKKDVNFDLPLKTPSPAMAKSAKKPRKTPARKTKEETTPPPAKRNSSEYDQSMFNDVQVRSFNPIDPSTFFLMQFRFQVVLDRLENTPAHKLADPNVVFDRLETVKRSPMRAANMICNDVMRHIWDTRVLRTC